MASSMLTISSNEPTIVETETQTEREKTRGKKTSKSNSSAKKKPPQRGMGVAQLERLRLQERWKKLTDTDPIRSQFQNQISQSSVGSPLFGNGGNGSGSNRCFIGLNGGCGNGPGYDRVSWDPRFGNGRNVLVESTNELSSIPNMQCGFDPCGVYFKKKRTNDESRVFINGDRDKFMEASSMINRCKFTGLDLGINNGDSMTRNFSTNVRVASKEVEVKAVHRNGSLEGGSIFMEYDFLPNNNKASFYSTIEATSSKNDTDIDLSLKL